MYYHTIHNLVSMKRFPINSSRLLFASSNDRSSKSIPRKFLPFLTAAFPTVPSPTNGSNTSAPLGLPARIQISNSSSGPIAVCLFREFGVAICQTERLRAEKSWFLILFLIIRFFNVLRIFRVCERIIFLSA